MSGVTSFSLSAAFAIAVLAAAPTDAFAGEWDNKCRQEGQKQSQECQNAVNQAGAADAATAGQKAATTGASANIKPGTGAQSAQIAEQTARLQSAKARCEAAKQQCESKCDSEKGKAQPHASNPKDPRHREAKSDVGTIDGTKNSTCTSPIMAMIGQLDSGLGQLAQAQQGTGNTGNSSGAMPPIMPPSNKSDDKKDNATDTANNQNQPLDCTQSQNTRYSDCNDYYINKCSGNMGQAGCDQFINRYCGSMNGSESATTNQVSNFSLSSANSATANLVADKQGEGMGSSFCGKANGYRFCQTSGREQCPSCQSITNWSTALSSDQLKQAQNTCPSDPMFADPAIAAQLNNSNGSATDNPATGSLEGQLPGGSQLGNSATFGSGAPGTSGGTGSNAGRASLGNEAGIAEGTAVGGGSIDLNSGEGGGSSWHGSDERDPDKRIGMQSVNGQRAPANQLVSNKTDVANQFGPNIFSISTSTYRALCTRGRFLHCRER